MTKRFVIFSLTETIAQREPMFWHNGPDFIGWGSLQTCMVFSMQEYLMYTPPGTEGIWLQLPEDEDDND